MTLSAHDREERLDELVTAYLQAVASGSAPDRQEFLAQHPEMAPDQIGRAHV